MTGAIGRRNELASIASAAARAKAGARQVVLVQGPPGIGKSTVLDEAVAALPASWAVRRGGLTKVEQPLSWAGLMTLLGEVADDVVAGLPEGPRHALLAALGRGGGGGVEPSLVAAAVAGALTLMAARAPLAVVVDDVHWLDASTAACLSLTIRATWAAPILFLLAVRDGQRMQIEPARLVGAEDLTTVVLSGLSPAGLHQLVETRCPGVRLRRPQLIRLHLATGGNPLHAVETARLLDAGVPLDDALLPATLHATVADHVRSLEPGVREVLAAAALAAQPTPLLLSAAVPRLDVPSALAVAEQQGVLAVRTGRVRFTHPLLQAAAAEAVDRLTRQRLHRRLAELVEDGEARARHLAAAGDGPDELVAAALEVAAGSASDRGATDAAAELYDLAVAHTPVVGFEAARRRRQLAAGTARFDAGDHEGAVERIRPLAEAPSSLDEDAAAGLMLVSVVAHLDGIDPARRLLEPLAERLRPLPPMRLRALRTLARVHMFDDLPRALRIAQTLLVEARALGDPELVGDAESAVQLAAFLCGERIDASTLSEAARSTQGRMSAQSSASILGELLVWSDRVDEAIELNERHLAQAEAEGVSVQVRNTLDQLADATARAGRWTDAEAYLALWLEQERLVSERAASSSKMIDLAWLLAAQGRADEARQLVATCSAALDSYALIEQVQFWGRTTFVSLALGDAEDAVRRGHRAHHCAERLGYRDVVAVPFRADLAEALLATGAVDDAAAVADEHRHRAEQTGLPRALAESARSQALVAAARGDLDGAEALVLDALGAHEHLAVPFEHARTLLAAGAVARRAGRRSQARTRLEQAHAQFTRLGATPWRHRAEDELARVGSRPTTGVLTPTEQQVAELVAAGRTNAEVAAALFLSPKTVEANLTRVYRKVGVRSRTELATRLAVPG